MKIMFFCLGAFLGGIVIVLVGLFSGGNVAPIGI